MELLDEDGESYWNTCFSLTDPDTVRRERESMSLARSNSPASKGVLLYHELDPVLVAQLEEAKPAWRWLLEREKRWGAA